MSELDRRLNAFRDDLADIALQGRVQAERFVAGQPYWVSEAQAPLRRAPSHTAMLLTEGLFGESVTVFDQTANGWAWVQLADDHYVGWTPLDCLTSGTSAPTHVVSVLRTFAFASPDIKSAPILALPLGAKVQVVDRASDKNASYGLICPEGAVVVQHLREPGRTETDWTSVAERFLGVPYLWGGKTASGLDCSGLVQIALAAGGIPAQRDSDMQEAALGNALALGNKLPPLRRGDLVFWRGHVGIMRNADELLHANAYHMAVAVEPLAETIARFSAKGVGLTSVRRIGSQ